MLVIEKSVLDVRMLGRLSLSLGGREINDSDNRSKKVWLLLAYMISCRSHPVTQEELIGLLWGDENTSGNPANALKTMFHRLRTMLDGLGESMGHYLIIRTGGNYAWNREVAFHFDVEDFESLCKSGAAAKTDKARLDKYMNALALYEGDFLPKLSSEPWVVPISVWFHDLYVQTVCETAELLEAEGRMGEASAICRRALAIEPYKEELYSHLMRELLAMGDNKAAVTIYRTMSDLMFDNFAITPSDEIKALYREASNAINDREVTLDFIREQLRESDALSGAIFCDYDLFRVIYRAQARSVARSGDAVHLGLLSAGGANGKPLSRQSLEVCMDNLQAMICANLRRGDVASQCSVSQYILMLPQANYENACMVCDRITKAFRRQYPHTPAVLNYSVQPIEPTL